MLRRLIPLLASCAALLSLPSAAYEGSCSTLAVTSSTEDETTTWTVDVTGGQADSMVFAAVGDTAGETVFELGALGSLTICLEQPFILLPVGFADADGDVSLSFDVPAGDPLGIDLILQAASVSFGLDFSTTPPTFGLDACTSNTASLSI